MQKNKIDIGTLFGLVVVMSKGDPQVFAGLMQTFVLATQQVNRPYWQEMTRHHQSTGSLQLRNQR